MLNVTQAEQTFTFDNVYFQPVPALLCEFSAPVKLEYKWSDQQLTFLMRHARNDFSRWDAAQSLLATYIKLNVARHQQGNRYRFRCMSLMRSAQYCWMRKSIRRWPQKF